MNNEEVHAINDEKNVEALDGDVARADVQRRKRERVRSSAAREFTTCSIKCPPWSYICLELMTEPATTKIQLDDLTVRGYLTSSLTQFLGLSGSAISIDILKVEGKECWLRVPREDLGAVVAAAGGWVGGNEKSSRVSWRVRASGNWLGSLLSGRSIEKLWLS